MPPNVEDREDQAENEEYGRGIFGHFGECIATAGAEECIACAAAKCQAGTGFLLGQLN